MRAADAGYASVGKSAAGMLRPRLHGRIYADPTEASPVADAGFATQLKFY